MSTGIAIQLKGLILAELDVKISLPDIDEYTPLFDGGMNLDSFAIVEFITLVEKKFDFEIQDEDLVPENFVDVASIAALIDRRKNGAG